MKIWNCWWRLIKELRPCFSRERTFLWFVLVAMCFTVRDDFAGATSLIPAMGLDEFYYDRILDFFHSSGINLQMLKSIWTKIVIKTGLAVQVGGRVIVVGDGIKIPKEGKKMPGVKSLHQESESNSKPEFIMGHSFQALALLTSALSYVFATPLAAEIHEGIVESNRDSRTLLGKMATLVQSSTFPQILLTHLKLSKSTAFGTRLKSLSNRRSTLSVPSPTICGCGRWTKSKDAPAINTFIKKLKNTDSR